MIRQGPRRVAVWTAHFHPHVGGVERFSAELWRRLVERHWEVTVVTCDTSGDTASVIDGLQIMRLPSFRLVEGRVPVPVPRGRLVQQLRALQKWAPAVMVTNTRFFVTSMLGVGLAKRWHLPSFHIEHGSDHMKLGNAASDLFARAIDHTIGSWVVRNATRCVAVSAAAASFVCHIGRREVGVLHNGVDVAQFEVNPGGWRTRLGIGEADQLLLYVGRLIAAKGILILLDGIQILNDKRIHLVVVGDGPLMPQLRRRNQPRVHLVGYQARPQVAELLKACDLFVHPSVYPEGLPTSVLEAAAAGSPILATDIGGTREVIPSGDYGVLIPPGQVALLAHAIAQLLDNERQRAAIGSVVKERTRSVFSWDRIADTAEEELRRVLDRQNA